MQATGTSEADEVAADAEPGWGADKDWGVAGAGETNEGGFPGTGGLPCEARRERWGAGKRASGSERERGRERE